MSEAPRPLVGLAMAGIVVSTLSCREPAPEPLPGPSATLVDHHVHLLSEALIADWKSLGVSFSRPDSAYSDPAVALGELKSVAEGGPSRGGGGSHVVLLPMAHLYGNRDFRAALGMSIAEEEAAVRRENEHVMRQAALYPERMTGVCGVDVLRPYALQELDRCLGLPGAGGIKLHLASAGVDLRSPEHRARISEALRLPSGRGVGVWLHLDTQSGDLEAEDIVAFADEVLGPFPELDVVIAHLGGSGGYGPWTQQVFTSLSGWLEGEDASGRPRRGFRFDISAIWLPEPSEGVAASTPGDAVALRRDVERYGTDRLVFGTDYPVFSAPSYWAAIASPGVLGPAVAGRIARNRFPVASQGGPHSP